MKVERLAIGEVILLTPPRFRDPRGFFSETWKQGQYAEIGIPGPFIQDNHAVSTDRPEQGVCSAAGLGTTRPGRGHPSRTASCRRCRPPGAGDDGCSCGAGISGRARSGGNAAAVSAG